MKYFAERNNQLSDNFSIDLEDLKGIFTRLIDILRKRVISKWLIKEYGYMKTLKKFKSFLRQCHPRQTFFY